jgi:macrolide transport system ATP-binding/permease protein
MKFFAHNRKQRELDEEIEGHLAMEIQQRIDRGESPEDARANASRQFGNVALVKEITRESWRSRALDRIVHDLRHVMRHTWATFRREPGILVVTFLTLALVMGANTIMFSSINSLMLRNRPGSGHTEQLVDFVHISPEREDPIFSYPNYRDYRDANSVFTALAAYSGNEPMGMRTDKGGTEIVRMAPVSGNYFDVLEVRPVAGRLLAEQDDRPAATPAAVISHRLWQQRFEGELAAIGSSIVLQGRRFTIVGVASDDFVGTTVVHDDVWIPLAMYGNDRLLKARAGRWLGIVGRLKPGTSLQQASAAMTLQTASLQRHPENKGNRLRLVNHWYQGFEPEEAMKGLMGMSLAVLLVACANIAAIGLSRALARQPEIAVRLALGAPRRRVALQLLWETVALFTPAALIGIWIASSLPTTALCATCGMPEVDMTPDWRVGLVVLGLMMTAAIISTIAPALQAMRTDLTSSLKNKSGGSSSRKLRLQGVLTVAQVAASITLLIVGVLYLRSLVEISSTRAFDPLGVHVAALNFNIGGLSRKESQTFVTEALKRSSVLPGMTVISAARDVPQNDQSATENPTMPSTKVWRTGEEIIPNKPHLVSELNGISPRYFETLKIPLIQGRDFRPSDSTGKSIAIVSESVAKALWPTEDPIGKAIYVCPEVANCKTEIVGLVADAVRGKPAPVVYRPLEQAYAPWVYLLFRGLDSKQSIPAVRKTLSDIDANLPIVFILQMKEILRSTFFYYHLIVWSAGLLGLIAAALAALGIYGVASHAVACRMREIGIRTALGARPAAVIRTVIRRSIVLTAIGLPIGCAAALFVARAVPAVNLYRVNDSDPVAYIAACAGIVIVAFLASYVPARRAAKSDPMIVLRHE